MKKFLKFIFGTIKFLFIVFCILVFSIYFFSVKNNMSFEDAISQFKNISTTIINTNIKKPSSSTNNNIDNTNTIIQTPNSENINEDNYYYYNQLDDTSKIIYDSLENNKLNLKKENYVIDFSTTFNDLLHESLGQYKLNRAFQSALDAFFYDHPELFYLDLTKISLSVNSLSIGPLTTYTTKIVPSDNKNYLHSSFSNEQEVNLAITNVENARDKIINNIQNNNIYNNILYIHDTLVEQIEYDITLSKENSHNIYGAFINKEVVCEGYAKAFKYLMDSLNIECILVSGVASDSNKTESHMWNYVKLNNKWYGVDVTWDDPIIIGGNGTKNNLRHDYFLKGFDTFVTSHSVSGKISDTGIVFNIPCLSNQDYK